MKNDDCKNRKTVENTQQTPLGTNEYVEQQRLEIGHAYTNTLRGVPKNINNRKPKVPKTNLMYKIISWKIHLMRINRKKKERKERER